MDKKSEIDEKGTSMAVRQFVEILRGENEPHAPSNPWRVEAVREEQRYCLTCCGERWFDVVEGHTFTSRRVMVRRCRCCGAEE